MQILFTFTTFDWEDLQLYVSDHFFPTAEAALAAAREIALVKYREVSHRLPKSNVKIWIGPEPELGIQIDHDELCSEPDPDFREMAWEARVHMLKQAPA